MKRILQISGAVCIFGDHRWKVVVIPSYATLRNHTSSGGQILASDKGRQSSAKEENKRVDRYIETNKQKMGDYFN